MCMDFAPGGDLLGLITHEQNKKQKLGRTDEACDLACAQFYIAEIVEAVEYLHGMQILHRDLKPESKSDRNLFYSVSFVDHVLFPLQTY